MFGPVLTVTVSGLEPGKYTVEIDAAENYFDAPGKRVMSVRCGEQVLAEELDLLKEAGKHKAYTMKGEVTHPGDSANKPLQFTLTGVVDNAKFDSIRVKNATGHVVAETTAAGLKKRAQKWHSDNGDGTYTNPVITADFPDPDVVRVNDTYYMVTTTMFVFPGVTVLKSKDLVNWEYCSNAIPRFDFGSAYNLESGNRYGRGQWATCIKHNNGKFYLLFITLDEGGILCSADQAEGPWEIKKLPKGFYDAGLFFDDDGRIYVGHGYGKISITELDQNFAPKGDDVLVFTGDIRGGLEGTRMYKINGYYYLYCTYGGPDGIQVALRSKNIHGPYEQKVVINETKKGVNFGVHQGALVETQTGEWWTMLFVDAGPFGRFPSLHPVTWTEGWPMVGIDGSGVITHKKPNVGKEHPIAKLPTSDEFNDNALGMQWGWNHNPHPGKWSLTEKPGCLRLKTVKVVENFTQAPNTLTQRIFANYVQSIPTIATTHVSVANMKNGDIAGLAVFQDPYAFIAVKQVNGEKQLVMVNNGETVASVPFHGSTVFLRAGASNGTRKARFEYSLDNHEFKPLGNELEMRFNLSVFTGNKFALFNFAMKEPGGAVDFDWFRAQQDGFEP